MTMRPSKGATIARCALALLALAGGLAGCVSVPITPHAVVQKTPPPTGTTRIAARIRAEGCEPPDDGRTEARLITTGYRAWEDRLRLTELADHSLDLQYFSWTDDASGRILLSHVIDAADRGVHVRLLIDDMLALDQRTLSLVAAHPDIQVRLFNPFSAQYVNVLARPLEWLANDRLNVRMHNKMFIADDTVGIIGGRNIEDRYFDIDPSVNDRDLDALVIGPAVHEMATSFDEYWNSAWAVPIDRLEPPAKRHAAHAFYRDLRRFRDRHSVRKRFAVMHIPPLADYQVCGDAIAVRAELIADPPEKVVHRKPANYFTIQALAAPYLHKRLIMGMAYAVPTKPMMEEIKGLRERGIDVELLTNSMASIDFPAAFAGYVDSRVALLNMGVKIHEYAIDARYASCPVSCAGAHMIYHSKFMVFDNAAGYVGSLNWDPRSIDLNTEAGLLVYSHRFAERLLADYHLDVGTRNSWQVTHASPLTWMRPGPDGDPEVRHSDPHAGLLRRLGVQFWDWMPIRDQY